MKKLIYGFIAVVAIIWGISSVGTKVSPTTSVSTPQPGTQSPQVEQKEESKDEVIPFSSKTIDDPNLASGTLIVTQEGTNGKITHYFQVTYTDGRETARTETKTTRVEPVDKITSRGTYVVPPGPPAGASAICRDGTYSYSQNRRGTCSHHGGVAQWL